MTEAQFGTLPIKNIFIKLTIPSILSMLFSSLYMMTDGVFVGRCIGSEALAAVNLIMPIMSIVFALPNMIAVGSSVKVSTALGENRPEHARHLFSASVLIVMGMGACFTIIGALFLKRIIFFSIKDAVLAQMAYEYARVFVYSQPFIMPLFAMDNFLRACGRAKYSMYVNVAMSVFNVALDWLFIVVMRRGIAYSALASVISMLIGSALSFAPFFTKRLTLYFIKPKITKQELTGIVYNGGSEFFGGIADSVISAVTNGFLLALGGNVAVASYSIVMYIDVLLMGAMFGITDAIQPAVSYNYGAKKLDRSHGFLKIASIVTASISLICMAALLIFPRELAGIFTPKEDTAVLNMATTALVLFAPSYLFTWYNMLISAFLTAMDKPKESMIIMLFRAIIFPLGSIVVLTAFIGVNGVFLSTTISAALTFVAASIIWHKQSAKQN